jgi:shikimate dehydrogenase
MLQYTPDINGDTKALGIVGEAIKHTWSPRIHNASANFLGINCIYMPFDLPANKIQGFLDLQWELGALGFNVTVPHKTTVADLFPNSELSSVNTIYRGESGWSVASTDAEGFENGLNQISKNIADFKKIVILGSGGVVSAFGERWEKNLDDDVEIHILRRNPSLDNGLANIFSDPKLHDFTCDALAPILDGAGEETLLIQCTSAPLRGDDLSHLVPALETYQGIFVDTVYGQSSAMYYRALALDLKVLDGEAMLIEQARLSQMFWWGRCAPYKEIALAIRGK